ncbi:hypothetical protein M2101_002317 [Parabacteroides sp. PM5-20]|uniref:hypothetical protein n=1 Tax=Parabacteroides sp. PM5-20 TaxID=2940527 RepID=UPI002476F93F|nr:hypothetical protein [Parabacteroides sp. PM5-20]MDH6535631.1 hypothetical protein [Parabacteroides sp. PM5-20]
MQELIKLNIPDLKDIEPLLTEYFGYKRNMISNELTNSYHNNYKISDSIPNKEKYMVSDPHFNEYAIDEGVFDWRRYAPRKEGDFKIFDTNLFMMDTDHFLVFEIPDPSIHDKLQDLFMENENKLKIESEKEFEQLYNVLLMVYIIYSKYKAGELYTDIAWSDDVFHYQNKVRPEMLKLYDLLQSSKPKQKGKSISPKPITITRGNKSMTIDDSAFWLSGLLNEYLNIYLGVSNLKEAQEEYDSLYKPTKGRKGDLAFNILVMGTYYLVKGKFRLKSQLFRFILDYLDAIGYFEDDDKRNDENYLGAAIAYLVKQKFKPQWKPKQMEDYRTSPNNPSSEYLW